MSGYKEVTQVSDVDQAYQDYLACSLVNEAIELLRDGYELDSFMIDRLRACDIDVEALMSLFDD